MMDNFFASTGKLLAAACILCMHTWLLLNQDISDAHHMCVMRCAVQVIYGDTDSIMIHTATHDVAAAKSLGEKIKLQVNKRYK